MEKNPEIIKAKIYQAKVELEKKEYNYIGSDATTNITIQYSCKINQIVFKNQKINSDLVSHINLAIDEVKKKMSEEYVLVLKNMGIKM
jgi:hypothetical protein